MADTSLHCWVDPSWLRDCFNFIERIVKLWAFRCLGFLCTKWLPLPSYWLAKVFLLKKNVWWSPILGSLFNSVMHTDYNRGIWNNYYNQNPFDRTKRPKLSNWLHFPSYWATKVLLLKKNVSWPPIFFGFFNWAMHTDYNWGIWKIYYSRMFLTGQNIPNSLI